METESKEHPFKHFCFDFIEKNFHKLSQREIARQLNVGKTSVNNWSRKLGLRYKKFAVDEGFFKKWSPEMAYILGYIAADGNIAWDKKKCYNSLTITACAKDKKHLEKVRKVMQITKLLLFGQATNSYRLIIANKIICLDLMSLGIMPRKSLTIKLPIVPAVFLPHFIRGIIDGDGSVKFYNRTRSPYFEISISSGSPEFIKSLRKAILENVGVDSRIFKTPSCFLLRYSCKRGLSLAWWIYNDASLFLARKRDKYLEAMK